LFKNNEVFDYFDEKLPLSSINLMKFLKNPPKYLKANVKLVFCYFYLNKESLVTEELIHV
jgi:hypothetical protein